MVEPLLSGIVLGLIPVTISGLFVTAYLQYRRGDQLNFQNFWDLLLKDFFFKKNQIFK